MARDTRAAFLAELAKVSPQIREAFERAVLDVRSTAQARAIDEAIKRAIETGNIGRGVQEVMAAIQLGPEFWAPLDRSISEAFYAGGVYQTSLLPKRMSTGSVGPLIVRFDGRHPNAEAWSRQRSAAMITEISTDTETVVRETIAHGVETSRPYRRVRQDLIGRTEGNERKGGLIGLHSRQAAYVRKAREQLESLDGAYFSRKLRDKRFDATVKKAIKGEISLTQADIDKITGRYSDRLLQARARTVARTEANKAMNAGRAQGIQQMIDDGKIPADAVTKIWDATPGPRTRDSHAAMSGQAVKWGAQFESPVTGAHLDWPHDESAPAEEVVNCRCSCRFRIDWKRVAEWRESFALAA